MVWNTDLIETMELEDLTDQAAQDLYCGVGATSHELPGVCRCADDKAHEQRRLNCNLDANITVAESEVGKLLWNVQSESLRSSMTQLDEVRADMTSASKAEELQRLSEVGSGDGPGTP